MIWFRKLRRLADPSICLVCRHARVLHEHWRAGSDCGVCGCERFR